jgi:hypothetical protein
MIKAKHPNEPWPWNADYLAAEMKRALGMTPAMQSA